LRAKVRKIIHKSQFFVPFFEIISVRWGFCAGEKCTFVPVVKRKNLYNILGTPVLSFSIKPETIGDAPR
jgi:hypothetical protein